MELLLPRLPRWQNRLAYSVLLTGYVYTAGKRTLRQRMDNGTSHPLPFFTPWYGDSQPANMPALPAFRGHRWIVMTVRRWKGSCRRLPRNSARPVDWDTVLKSHPSAIDIRHGAVSQDCHPNPGASLGQSTRIPTFLSSLMNTIRRTGLEW